MRTESEGFLSRWSRLKQDSQKSEGRSEVPTPEAEYSDVDLLRQDAEQSLVHSAEQEPVLTDDDMPPLESLDENSDFSLFMSKGVSDELRNLALKKLFKNAVFNITDGLDEYAEDFTSFEKLGDIITCDMKHQLEMEARKRLEQEAESQDETIEPELQMIESETTEDQGDLRLAQNSSDHQTIHNQTISIDQNDPEDEAEEF